MLRCPLEVVEDARQNFAAASSTTLPPLPIAPMSRRSSSEIRMESRSQRASRVPRKIIAANEIFAAEYAATQAECAMSSFNASTNDNDPRIEYRRSWMKDTIPDITPEGHSRLTPSSRPVELPCTPSHTRRRATIVTRSPEAPSKKPVLGINTTPSRRREKSRSQNDLGRPITPVTRLEFEIEQCAYMLILGS